MCHTFNKRIDLDAIKKEGAKTLSKAERQKFWLRIKGQRKTILAHLS